MRDGEGGGEVIAKLKEAMMAIEQMQSGYAEALRRIAECKATGEQQLALTNLALTTVPPAIGQLSALEMLDLSGNHLSALPPELIALGQLATLLLHDNPALNIPAAILGSRDWNDSAKWAAPYLSWPITSTAPSKPLAP